MEMANTEAGSVPKSYSLNMFKDFVPMSVFSETNQGDFLKCLTLYVSFNGCINIDCFLSTWQLWWSRVVEMILVMINLEGWRISQLFFRC